MLCRQQRQLCFQKGNLFTAFLEKIKKLIRKGLMD